MQCQYLNEARRLFSSTGPEKIHVHVPYEYTVTDKHIIPVMKSF